MSVYNDLYTANGYPGNSSESWYSAINDWLDNNLVLAMTYDATRRKFKVTLKCTGDTDPFSTAWIDCAHLRRIIDPGDGFLPPLDDWVPFYPEPSA